MTPTTGHNGRAIALIIIMFIVSGFAAIHNSLSPHTSAIIDTITAILLFTEHLLNGNTSNMQVSKAMAKSMTAHTTSTPTGTQ